MLCGCKSARWEDVHPLEIQLFQDVIAILAADLGLRNSFALVALLLPCALMPWVMHRSAAI